MGGLYDAATLRALVLLLEVWRRMSPHDGPAQGQEKSSEQLVMLTLLGKAWQCNHAAALAAWHAARCK